MVKAIYHQKIQVDLNVLKRGPVENSFRKSENPMDYLTAFTE